LVHVTVAPTGTEVTVGLNVQSPIAMSTVEPALVAGRLVV
jgi:hypothetical protein